MAVVSKNKRVLITVGFDLISYNVVKFLEEAAKMGDLYVCVENDKKTAPTVITNEIDRLYMIQSIKYVYDARLLSDNDHFESILDAIKPDIFVVDKHNENKKNIMSKKNIQYIVSTHKQSAKNAEIDEKNEKKVNDDTIRNKDTEIKKLQKEKNALAKLCNALQALSNASKTTSDALRKQNIKLQKDLVNSFAMIGILNEKYEQKENDGDTEDEEEEDKLESCSICFGDIEISDLVMIEECKHKYHTLCLFQCVQTDVSIYEKMPVCAVCDADGKQVNIPNDMTVDVIHKQNAVDFLSDYEKIVAANTN